jgi:hypothetical protein
VEPTDFPRKVPRLLRFSLKTLQKVLSCADTILGSLVKLVGRAEALREIKEAVEKLAGDAADVLPDESSSTPSA